MISTNLAVVAVKFGEYLRDAGIHQFGITAASSRRRHFFYTYAVITDAKTTSENSIKSTKQNILNENIMKDLRNSSSKLKTLFHNRITTQSGLRGGSGWNETAATRKNKRNVD